MSSLQITLLALLVSVFFGALVWPWIKGWTKFKDWDSFRKRKQQLGSGRVQV